jgi:hypothetical protein
MAFFSQPQTFLQTPRAASVILPRRLAGGKNIMFPFLLLYVRIVCVLFIIKTPKQTAVRRRRASRCSQDSKLLSSRCDSNVILPFEPRQTSPTTVNNIERTHIRTHKRFTNIHPTKTPSPRRFTLRAAFLLKKRDSAPRVHQAGSRSITISQSIPTHHYFVSTIYRHIIISYPHKCNNEVL